MTSNYIFQLNICDYNPYVTSSLSREWVCPLQLLLVLTSVVIFRSESRGTHDHILRSQNRDSPDLAGQVAVFIPPPRNRVALLYPQALRFLFRRLLRLTGLRRRYSTPPPHWFTLFIVVILLDNSFVLQYQHCTKTVRLNSFHTWSCLRVGLHNYFLPLLTSRRCQ
jgi:hypothetical protein